MQSIHPTTASKQTQAQKKRGSMARKLQGANAKSYRLKLKLKLSRLVSTIIIIKDHSLRRACLQPATNTNNYT